MVTLITKQEAKALRERLSNPMERVELFPDSDAYGIWIEKISHFISSNGRSSAFGVEAYRADFEFFTASSEEQMAILFLTKFVALEIAFFGPDWIISVSSYPQYEGSRFLEHSIRFYGVATMSITS